MSVLSLNIHQASQILSTSKNQNEAFHLLLGVSSWLYNSQRVNNSFLFLTIEKSQPLVSWIQRGWCAVWADVRRLLTFVTPSLLKPFKMTKLKVTHTQKRKRVNARGHPTQMLNMVSLKCQVGLNFYPLHKTVAQNKSLTKWMEAWMSMNLAAVYITRGTIRDTVSVVFLSWSNPLRSHSIDFDWCWTTLQWHSYSER